MRQLASSDRCTGRELKRAADEMGVRMRQAAGLLRAYRERIRGRPARENRTGCHYRLDTRSEALIQDAIAVAGSDARLSDVLREIHPLARTRSLSVPSEKAIRARFGDRPLEVDLGGRLSTSCRFIADLVELDLPLSQDKDGEPRNAHLLAMIDVEQGSILAFELCPGAPPLSASLRSLETMRKDLRFDDDLGVGLPDNMLGDLQRSGCSSGRGHYVSIARDRYTANGSALAALLGRKIGRIRLYRGTKGTAASEELAIPFALATEVVRLLVRSGWVICAPETELRPAQRLCLEAAV